jgi:hypothetical protein
MGKLYFRVAADYQEVIRLREEIEKLKSSLQSLDSSMSKSSIKELESQLKSATKRMEELVMSAAKAATALDSELSANASKSAESMKALVESQKSSSAKQMGYVDSLILKLSDLEKAYRALPEGADASAIISEFNKTKSALDTVGKSIKDNIRINTIDVHPFHLVETSIADIQAKIKALNDYKVTIPIDRFSQIQTVEAQVERLKGTLSSLGRLSFSDVLSMPENSLADIQSKIKSFESVKARLNIDSTDITKANSEVERLKSIIKEVNAAAIAPQKSFTEVMGMSEGSLNEISAKLREIARLKGGADITDTSRESSISAIYREEQALLSLQKEKVNEIKVNNLAEGSVLQLRAQLSLLTASYDAMSGAMRKSSAGDALLADIKNTSTELSEAEELSRRFQRNVGNYKSGFNGIQFQVNQLARELPSAAYGINVFISAVSNNWPMLIDEIKYARAANEALKASGQSGIPIWKQITGAIFSWQTALLLLTTYLITNWKQVANWVSGLFDAKNAAKLAGDEVKEMYKSFANSAGSELGKLNALVNSLKTTKQGTDEWYSARSKLLSQYPDVFKGMDIENIKYGQLDANIRQVTKSILDKARADALATTSAKIGSDAIGKQQMSYDNIRMAFIKKFGETTGKAYFDTLRSQLEVGGGLSQGMKSIVSKFQEDFVSINSSITGATQTSIGKKNVVQQNVDEIIKSQKDANEKLKQANSMMAPIFAEEGSKGLQLLTDRRKALQDQYNKIAPADLNSKDAKSLFNQIKKLDDEIDKYNVSKTDKANKKTQEQLNAEKVAADERAKKIAENNEKLKLAVESSETDLSEAKMAAMDEGYAKQQAQIKLNYQKRQDDIKKRTAELIKTAQENEKLAWINANPDYKKKGLTFTPTITGASQLTGDAKTELANMQAAATLEMTTAQKNSLKSLLDKYQDYAAKRTELEKKYNDDVKALEEERADAMSKHDSATVIATTEAIVEAKKQFDQSVGELDFEQLQKSIDWENVFGNLEEVSTRSLKALRDKLSKYLSESKNLSPDSIKAVSESLQKMDEQIKNRDPFEAISSGLFDYEEAARRVSLAQEQLNRLTREGLDGSSDYAQAESDLANAESDRTRALIQTSKALNQVAQYGQQAVGAANDIIDTLEMVGVNVDENTKKYIQGTGEIMDGLSSIDFSKPMTVITGSIKVMKGTVRQITSLLGWGSTNWTKQYEELKLSLGAYVDVLQRVIDKEKEALEGMSGSSAMATYQEAKVAIESQIDSYRRLAAAAGNAGGGMFSHSKGYKTNDALSGYWESLSKSAGITVDSIDDLYKLSGDQLSKIMSENAYAWSLIDGDIRGYLENIIDAQGELDDLSDSIQQALTGISFDSVKDGLDDLLQDTSTTMSDIADNFNDMMRDSVLKFVKDSYLTNALKDWYAKFANYSASDNKLTEAEITELQSLYETIYGNAQSMYDQALAASGISSSSYSSQSATSKSAASLTQDTAEELNGRFTAMQISMETMSGKSSVQADKLSAMDVKLGSMLTVSSDIKNIADENRQLLAQSYLELVEIRNNTGDSAKSLKNIESDIAQVKKNTAGLV